MSEFKFACPICGQHITCDRDKAGSRIECPTCFRQIIVPQPPSSGEAKFVLTAAEAQHRPVPSMPAPELPPSKPTPMREYLLWGAVFVLVAGMGMAAYALRHKLFRLREPERISGTTTVPEVSVPESASAGGPIWTLNLESVKFPDSPASGRVAGRDFVCHRATLHGGTLNLRQGPAWPPDVGLTIYLDAERGEDMAGRQFVFSPGDKLPRMVMRWKDSQGNPVTRPVTVPYALRLEFGPVTSNRVPGKIYCCVADQAKSYVAGMFEAEIRKPSPRRSSRQ